MCKGVARFRIQIECPVHGCLMTVQLINFEHYNDVRQGAV